MTSAGVIFYMVLATLMGDDVVCSVKLSKVRHVPRDHVLEEGTCQKIAILRTGGRIEWKQH